MALSHPKSRFESPSRQSGIVPLGDSRTIAPNLNATASDALIDMLAQLGVEYAFGLFGGAIAPLSRALNESSIRILHFRHEAGAAFAAIEASIASGKPVVVFSTTGPGLTNSLTGMAAARAEGAKVIFISGATSAAQRGRAAFQETSAYTLPTTGIFSSGPLCHFAVCIEDVAELDVVAARLAQGLSRSAGFVAHLAVPLAVQTSPAPAAVRPRFSSLAPCSGADEIDQVIELLAGGSFVIWAGFGAQGAARELLEFADLSGAPVMCSPRGKGSFPESHPNYLGVTGLGGHASVGDYVRSARPARILVLGTRMGEFTSFWDPELRPPAGFVQVDVDGEAFGSAYPDAPTVGVLSDVRGFLRALIERWPATARRPRAPERRQLAAQLRESNAGSVRPSYLMQEIQRHIVERSDAIVITEAGNSFALGSHYLHFDKPCRYRVSTSFGSMGHAVAGVVGAALARRTKAVSIAGDGAMLLLNEMNTAAQYGIDAVWIVLNDSRYGMIEQGMRSLDWVPFETQFPRVDFVMVARGMGLDGYRVEREAELGRALEAAMSCRGPAVIDVNIDPTELAPSGRRNQSLRRQGVAFPGKNQ